MIRDLIMRYVRLELIRLSDLLPHELIEVRRLKKVRNSIKSLGKVLKPVIIDEATGVIIDGHHRVVALKSLGLKYVPALLIRYTEVIKEIGTFSYLIKGSNEEVLQLLIRKLIKECEGCGNAEVIISNSLSSPYIIRSDLRIMSNTLMRLSRELSLSVIKLSPNDSCEKLIRGAYAVIKPLVITHKDVIKTAYLSNPYPPRTTYHVTKLKEVVKPFSLNQLR